MRLSPKVVVLISYYLISMAIFFYLYIDGDFKSGPCNPGLGILLFPLFALTFIILFIVSLVNRNKNEANKYMLFINLLVLVILIILMFVL
jgi:hypothetical protein